MKRNKKIITIDEYEEFLLEVCNMELISRELQDAIYEKNKIELKFILKLLTGESWNEKSGSTAVVRKSVGI